jgi:S-methylmethionine-dependent homocysteine/selenocysteine methylase
MEQIVNTFPKQIPGKYYITEGGVETEIIYKWGFDMPHFAMFPLLNNPKAAESIRGMYRRYLDLVAKYEHNALIGGFDYRASPDWGSLLGYSAASLHEANLQSIQFLRDIAAEYHGQIEQSLFSGCIGPRGDAYQTKNTMDRFQAAEYHAVQLATLKEANVDLAWALTFGDPEEAIGVCMAAKELDMPLAISFSLDSSSKLNTGVEFHKAVELVDKETNNFPQFYSLNCSHPDEFNPAITPGKWIDRVRCFRPNAVKMDKIALCKLGHLEEGNPIELGQQMNEVREKYPHIDIWGGCCGTCDVHLEQIMKYLPKVA